MQVFTIPMEVVCPRHLYRRSSVPGALVDIIESVLSYYVVEDWDLCFLVGLPLAVSTAVVLFFVPASIIIASKLLGEDAKFPSHESYFSQLAFRLVLK